MDEKPKSQSFEVSEENPDEFEVTGAKKATVLNNADRLIKQSPVFEIFGGMFRDDVTVEGKKKVNASLEPFFCISVDITDELTLKDSIHDYFQPEDIEGYRWQKKVVTAQKTRRVLSLPNILLVHVKRFYFDRGYLGKYEDLIDYPDILMIGKEYMAEGAVEGDTQSFELIGVVKHKG